MKTLLLLSVVLILSCSKETIIEEVTIIEPDPCVCIQSSYLRDIGEGQPPTINDTLLAEFIVECQDEIDFVEIDRPSPSTIEWYKIECE